MPSCAAEERQGVTALVIIKTSAMKSSGCDRKVDGKTGESGTEKLSWKGKGGRMALRTDRQKRSRRTYSGALSGRGPRIGEGKKG